MEQAKQSLSHAVEVTNNAEKAYIIEWLEAEGINSTYLESIFTLPLLVYTVDGGWQDNFEKVETTSSFREFVNAITK